MTMQEDYTVRLDSFEGPLDLLLYLVRKSEVDITEISIAEITDQYIAFLDDIDRVDVEVAGEFLVTAATLLELKSRFIADTETTEGESAEREKSDSDELAPGMELIKNLLEYKTYRDASDALEDRRQQWEQRYPGGRAGISESTMDALADEYAEVQMDDLEIMDLLEAFQRIVETVQFDRLGEHEVHFDDTPIELHQADIVDRLEREGRRSGAESMTMREIFEGRTRPEMIGLFLAILELVRQQRLAVAPQESVEDLRLTLRPEEAQQADASDDDDDEDATADPQAWDDDHIFDDEDIDDDDDEDLARDDHD